MAMARQNSTTAGNHTRLVSLALALLVSVAATRVLAEHGICQYEVWIVDQADTSNGTSLIGYGGYVHIFKSYDLSKPAQVVDLGKAASQLCLEKTGARTHAVVSFVASGHVLVIRADDRTPLACFRTTPGFNGARQAHAAFPTGDNRYVVIANQNGKKLERLSVDWEKEVFTHDVDATLPLYGNCTTPSGARCEDPAFRPDNAPICTPTFGDPKVAFATLRGGGLFVVDYTKSPMAIVAEYDNKTVGANGCGGVGAGNNMFINSGGGTAANLYNFQVYKFPRYGYSAKNPANTPRPKVVANDPDGPRDAHGAAILRDTKGSPKYFWQPDRYSNVIDVYSIDSDRLVHRIDLRAANLSSDPTPDLVAVSPIQDHAFISLRGPFPLSADPHVSSGATPGLGVLVIQAEGRKARFEKIITIANLVNGTNRADPHAIDLRPTNTRCTQVLNTHRRL
ncbi:hypothetical protein HXX76_001176 [Chlamydomonas incerta]|uniref:Uncharacterized protein n=1 Tax=Chlamydomonas incerta TaxID=51695 RepID=A0A835WBL6_CHLIN|nr:hypothetical protein HXX76_001176 [Chlamydomonas incerta]|eukprot:KAG2444423.1 hypothetical protein HXX76_001176 [Chlamydomonas incerta]